MIIKLIKIISIIIITFIIDVGIFSFIAHNYNLLEWSNNIRYCFCIFWYIESFIISAFAMEAIDN